MTRKTRAKGSVRRTLDVERGSGNVFADLGLENPKERLLKSELAMVIARVITAQRLTQTEVAGRVGLDQPKVSSIVRGRLAGFSVERLLDVIRELDQDVVITIGPAAKRRHQPSGKGTITVRRDSTPPARASAAAARTR